MIFFKIFISEEKDTVVYGGACVYHQSWVSWYNYHVIYIRYVIYGMFGTF